jgi:protein-S-isoprenylcysteine O-methyltransferase Ste14
MWRTLRRPPRECYAMIMALRHMLAIVLLPTVVVVVVPHWLMTSFAANDTRWDAGSPSGWISAIVGVAVFADGTLAPWDPTRALVSAGPYRHVRNPMISRVLAMLLGLAVIWGSVALGLCTLVFLLLNHIYFPASEEPGLRRRFGDSYMKYQKNVPRWIPRVTPWTGLVHRFSCTEGA